MVPRANTWQLWGKKSFLETSLNWFITVFVTGMRQYHCILPPLRTSLYFANLQVGVALLMCLVLNQYEDFMVEPLKCIFLMVVRSSQRSRAETSKGVNLGMLCCVPFGAPVSHIPSPPSKPREVSFSHGCQGKEKDACSTVTSFGLPWWLS